MCFVWALQGDACLIKFLGQNYFRHLETPFGTVKKFYRIKIGSEVVYGKAYARVSKRHSYTVVYKEEQGEAECYGHIQYFLLHRPHCYHSDRFLSFL